MTISHTDALAAADPRRSAWVSANAGAGKTHTLANRVSRLLLDGTKPERILCLTYTKSAAAEMQARLFARLGEWAMFDDARLGAAIADIGAPVRDRDGLKQARRLFALALETPGGLKIQTIHSFCERLLSRFPIEAKIPPSFRVLDEQTARDMIADAREQVLGQAGSGASKLAAAVAHIVTETSESRLHQILDAALGNNRRKMERFFSGLPKGDCALRELAERAHRVSQGDTVERIAEEFCAQAKAEAENLTSVVAWLATGGKTDRKLGSQLSAFSTRGFSTDAFRSLREAFCTTDGTARTKLASKGLCDASPSLAAYMAELAERYVAAEERCRAVRAALLADAALTLADAVREIYSAEKRARSALDYNDLISETLGLLERSDAAAWVLYKLDGGLDHVLIDEAQDTSPEQWRIVGRLTDEFFTGMATRDLFAKPRTIFAVGDQKQSIFSFQGADPSEFEVSRRRFSQLAQADFTDVRLQTSRRSAPEILEFVDAVFGEPAAREGLTSSADTIEHHPFRMDAKGRVEFWPAIKPAKTPEPDYWRPVDVASETSPVVQLAEKIAAKIRKWLDDGVRMPGHDRPIRAGDIMILMPRREPFATEIIRKLTQARVPVAGADRIRLRNEIAVMDLMALGHFALLPEDDLNLAALLRSPFIGLSEEELFTLANPRGGRSLWRELIDRRDELLSFTAAHAFLSDLLSRADYAPAYEFFAQSLNAADRRARMLARLGPEASDAIDEFLSLALEYEAANTASLQGFLHWIERADAEVKRDMERGRDQVRVMTVHGAKGLEADIVFLPDTTTLPDPPGRRGELLYQDDGVIFPIRNADACEAVSEAKEFARREALKEHRRLFYVALTRARDRLYVCGFENKNGIRDESWYRLAEAAMMKIGQKVTQSDGDIYALGKEIDEIDVRRGAVETSAPLPHWLRADPPAERGRPRLIRPSDDIADDEPATVSPVGLKHAQRFRRGLLIHSLLARLPEIAPEDRRTIALAFLAAQGEAAVEAAALTDSTLRVLNDPQFAPAFTPGSKGEIAIVADLPELGAGARVSGRIDRLAVTDAEVLALDFKTNRPPPDRLEGVPAIYIRQMALYRLALAKLFPRKQVNCALVWTEGPTLMLLPTDILDQEMARLAPA
ncbi:MAG: double-strand break repair helicase AddA [Alphaproteobacteria bacterium]|nr:double-strand break repair helicase AddA [Alphaproteobacteria bacterium]